MPTKANRGRVNRRQFLGSASLGAAAVAAAGKAVAEKKQPLLPTVRLGDYDVTRLVAGYNPIGGHSHCTATLSQIMREYFTVERTVEYLRRCEAQGMNTFQFDLTSKTEEALDILWNEGSKLQFLCLHADGRHGASIEKVMKHKAFAIAHHGGVTDGFFRSGKHEKVQDYVKRVHDHGALAGVSSHNPDNIKRIADWGWEVDFFMTCFQNVARTAKEQEEELGFVTVGEPFIESDRDRMTEVVRQVDQPCLAFKILGAGRRCANERATSLAFKYAFENIKKTDAVIVGMFPMVQDEVAIDAEIARKFA